MLTNPKSTFLKVKCAQCKNEQTVFNKAATDVNCLVCGKLLVKSKGGKAEIDAKIIGTVE
jgi:small subunit ribosomal protein S27e